MQTEAQSGAHRTAVRGMVLGAMLLSTVLLVGCTGQAAETQRNERQGQELTQDTRSAGERSSTDEKSTPETAAPDQAATATHCADGSQRRDLRMSRGSAAQQYTGHVIEPHGAEYDLVADVIDDGCTVSGSFEYVELGCSGSWTQIGLEDLSRETSQPQSVRVHLAENVTSNARGACAATAEVTLLLGPAGMFYFSNWVRADGDATDSKTYLETVQ